MAVKPRSPEVDLRRHDNLYSADGGLKVINPVVDGIELGATQLLDAIEDEARLDSVELTNKLIALWIARMIANRNCKCGMHCIDASVAF
ncbi:hypothetical protein DF038_11230 [Burkholderia cepacia]|nr:hypothetical protein DF038_11230 [Burkholderia cepacia]